MKPSAHQDPTLIAHGRAVLDELSASCRSLVYATLVSDDGFEVVSLTEDGNGRMASMSSSMQAIAEAVTHELKIGPSEYVIIASKLGHVVQLRIPNQALVLSSLFGINETLGKALSASRQSAAQLASLITGRS